MNDKILITGAGGQLGQMLSSLLPEALPTDTAELDITDKHAVTALVKAKQIGTIINCAAYNAVDMAEDDPETAYKINVAGPENLAQSGCKIIHFSTDYVFDGTGCRPYRPSDPALPASVYGKTKLAGEQAVLKNAETAVIIRTAWLYSPYGKNFVKTMLQLGAQKEQIGVVCDQIGTPTYAGDLAAAVVKILPQLTPENKGAYHYTDEGVCSWYDFATEIMTMAGLKCVVKPLLSDEYQAKAKRPSYSVLDKSLIKQRFGLEIPHWRQSLKKCLEELNQ